MPLKTAPITLTLAMAEEARARGTFATFARSTLLESRSELFEPPFHELRHPDGRRWSVRTSGSTVELRITLEDGEVVTRERAHGSAQAAERAMQSLLEEQRTEGFVDASQG